MPLPVQPVAKGSDSSTISILAVVVIEIGQEVIDIIRCRIVVNDERLKTRFVEFECAR